MDMEHEIKKTAPSAQQAAGSIDTLEFSSLLGELHAGYQYGPTSRYDAAHAALIEHITEWADSCTSATPAQPIAPPAEPMTTDEAREFLIGFMNEHFTDRTFHRYIRAQRSEGKVEANLAGDFAWQMATALRNIGAAPCAMCNGAGSVGYAPDGYFDCPECTAPVAQPIAVSAPTERKLLNAAMTFAKEHIEGDALHDDESAADEVVHASDERYNESKRLLCDAYLELMAGGASAVSAPTDEQVEAALVVYMAAWTDHDSMSQCKRNGIRAVLDFAARAAAPVSGPSIERVLSERDVRIITRAVRYLTEYECSGPAADLKSLLEGAAPVSGQGATIGDDAEFLNLLGHIQGWKDGKPILLRDSIVGFYSQKLIALIDSRPRSEDSRAEVADFIEKRAQEYLDGNAGTEHDTGAITWHYGEAGRDYYNTLTELAEEIRALASTTPQKADNE